MVFTVVSWNRGRALCITRALPSSVKVISKVKLRTRISLTSKATGMMVESFIIFASGDKAARRPSDSSLTSSIISIEAERALDSASS